MLLKTIFLPQTDDCQRIEFREYIKNKVLNNHVIESYPVSKEGMCKLYCYLQPNCVSYNYGLLDGGLFLCELSDKVHSQVSPNELGTRDGFIYKPIFLVNKLYYFMQVILLYTGCYHVSIMAHIPLLDIPILVVCRMFVP